VRDSTALFDAEREIDGVFDVVRVADAERDELTLKASTRISATSVSVGVHHFSVRL
jgi:hypothetical protein